MERTLGHATLSLLSQEDYVDVVRVALNYVSSAFMRIPARLMPETWLLLERERMNVGVGRRVVLRRLIWAPDVRVDCQQLLFVATPVREACV